MFTLILNASVWMKLFNINDIEQNNIVKNQNTEDGRIKKYND